MTGTKLTIMMINSIAVDTNVLVYLHDSSDARKRNIAENILAENPKIPSQVISEYLNVTKRILSLSKTELVSQCAELLKDCEIINVSCETLINSVTLIQKYDFQIFDSIIVAASLEAGCTILYSEDMQHNMVINNLIILNPFV